MEDSDNAAQQFIGCCLDCLLACIEDILEFINSFAFTICAIYGDDYCTAVLLDASGDGRAIVTVIGLNSRAIERQL